MLEGIDISYWQGAVNWQALDTADKKFVIIRGGDGAFRDPRRVEYAKGAKSIGIPVIETYHFLRWKLSAANMASLCRESYEAVQNAAGQPGRLWLDCEDTDPVSITFTWLQDVISRLSDLPLGVYTGSWWWNPKMPANHGLDSMKRWFSGYLKNNTLRSDPTVLGLQPIIPRGFTGWDIWQYTSLGTVAGINASVDLNIAKETIVVVEEEEDMMPPLKIVKARNRDSEPSWLINGTHKMGVPGGAEGEQIRRDLYNLGYTGSETENISVGSEFTDWLLDVPKLFNNVLTVLQGHMDFAEKRRNEHGDRLYDAIQALEADGVSGDLLAVLQSEAGRTILRNEAKWGVFDFMKLGFEGL